MAKNKAQKSEVLESIKKIAGESSTLVFSDFKGLSVAESQALRRALRGSDSGYYVAKKTLAEKAFKDAGFGGEVPALDGQLGIAYAKKSAADVLAPARNVYEFQKKLDGRITISGGVFGGKFVSKAEMTEIAQIPSRETLLGKLVNVINSPVQRFVIALDAIARVKPAA